MVKNCNKSILTPEPNQIDQIRVPVPGNYHTPKKYQSVPDARLTRLGEPKMR